MTDNNIRKYLLVIHYKNVDKVIYSSILYKLLDYAEELTNILGYDIYEIKESIHTVRYPQDNPFIHEYD